MDVLQCDTGTDSDGVKRVLCDLELQAKALTETLVQTTQECTAPRQHDAVSHDVGIELRRSSL